MPPARTNDIEHTLEDAYGSAPVGFRSLLVLERGTPADPAAFLSATSQRQAGDPFTAGDGSRWRVLAIESNLSDAVEFDALWTVEPLD